MFLIALISALFHTAQLQIGDEQLTVELADTKFLRSQGLMGRDKLEKGHGMLFVFDRPNFLSFWMLNTKIPLSIGFFDAKQKLIQIEAMHPPLSKSSATLHYNSNRLAQYALEVPQHWFEEHKITNGMKFTIRSEK